MSSLASRTIANAHFRVAIDPLNGSLAELVHPADTVQMSWVSNSGNAPWQPRSFQWGLGYADLGPLSLHRARWEQPDTMVVDSSTGSARVVYRIGQLRVEVTRTLAGDAFTERYAFTNTGATSLPLTRRGAATFAIYAPFNDHYTNAADVLEHRSHAHVWTGGTSSWVATFRMGGRAPHLGWVLTEGALAAYSIAGRDQVTSSNTRGVFLLHPAIPELAPGETRAVAWTAFWHRGWDDFFAQCRRRSSQFVQLEASRYTAFPGEEIRIAARGGLTEAPRGTVNGKAVVAQQHEGLWSVSLRADSAGPLNVQLATGAGVQTVAALNVVPSLDSLIAARVRFIVARQQVHEPGDPLDGAFLVYDNQLETMVRRDWGTDRNEGRERVGMGVLLARWLRAQPEAHRDPTLVAALEQYYAFVSQRLQRPDGSVLDGVGSQRVRLYDWPWVMQLHVEMARLTGSQEPLRRFVTTVENFYANGGDRFYPIGVPVLDGLSALRAAGMTAEHARVLARFVAHGERMLERGTSYPTSEVNFEQAIVGPAATFLLELHRATGEARWLEAARPHLRLLELFNGRQPDHRLNDVAIRHWDGYWFGKERSWGDTFPHYWSTLTALAFHHYAQATGDTAYARRADGIIRNNLSLFRADGRASAAFIYPLTVNGQAARFYDSYANDQDWALVHALQIGEERSR
ncbi:MAG: hypothetical protein FIB01_09145 [Gemmatimonadetes bacterium]|nr:hypothetical protein [Gemmatimonadota bacterium]